MADEQEIVLTEEQHRTLHRYHLMCRALGFTAMDFDGKSPVESEDMVRGAIAELKYKPTEAQVLFDQGTVVTIMGQPYELKMLPIDRDRAFRLALTRVVQDLIDVVMQYASAPAFVAPMKEPGETDAEYSARFDAAKAEHADRDKNRNKTMLQALIPYIMGDGLEQCVDLLFLYSPDLKAKESELRETAPSYELIAAAMEALNLAFPFVVAVTRGILKLAEKGKASGVFRF